MGVCARRLPLAFAEMAHGEVLAALYGEGAARSLDSGRSWQIAASGLNTHAPPIVVQPAADLLYALDREGALARSHDGGESWMQQEIGPSQAIASHMGAGAATVVAAVDDTLYIRTEQLGARADWRATDWRPVDTPAEQIGQLVLSPAFRQDETIMIGGPDNQLFLTQNGGASWQIVPPPRAHDALLQLVLTSPLTSPPAPLLGGEGGPAVLSPSGVSGGLTICAVTAALNKHNNYQLYLWQSHDKGQSWETLAGFESETPAVQLVAPAEPTAQTLFLATQNRLIKLHRDKDGELAVSQHFFEADLRITALTASPTYGADQTLYAGANRGVYISKDGGTTWTALSDDLPEQPVVALLPQGDLLRAVLLGGAVWAL